MIGKLLASVLGFRGMAIAGAVALAIGFGGGWKARDYFADAAATRAALATANARADALQSNLNRIRIAQEQDNQIATEASGRLAEMIRIHNGLLAEISSGKCFTAADVDRLRRGWAVPVVQPRNSPR